MGSLASRPSIPAVQAVYTPVYMPSTPSTPEPMPAVPVAPTEDDQASTRRTASLLERNRGVFSTVLTSFRGILSQNKTPSPRKTLLGE